MSLILTSQSCLHVGEGDVGPENLPKNPQERGGATRRQNCPCSCQPALIAQLAVLGLDGLRNPSLIQSTSRGLSPHHHIPSQLPEISWAPLAAPIIIYRPRLLPLHPPARPGQEALTTEQRDPVVHVCCSLHSPPRPSLCSLYSNTGNSGQLTRHFRITSLSELSPLDL